MTASTPFGPERFGFETLGTATGLSLIAGALAALLPALSSLTLTLVAVALGGWASLHYRRRVEDQRGHFGRPSVRDAVGLLALAAGGTAFVAPPALLAEWRSLLLALGAVPLWALGRGLGGPAGPSREIL